MEMMMQWSGGEQKYSWTESESPSHTDSQSISFIINYYYYYYFLCPFACTLTICLYVHNKDFQTFYPYHAQSVEMKKFFKIYCIHYYLETMNLYTLLMFG